MIVLSLFPLSETPDKNLGNRGSVFVSFTQIHKSIKPEWVRQRRTQKKETSTKTGLSPVIIQGLVRGLEIPGQVVTDTS